MKTAKLTVARLFKYYSVILQYKKLGYMSIFSQDLAEACGSTSAQVRKDFSLFGLTGNKRGGYVIDELEEQLGELLNKKEIKKVIIVGAGNIGQALMNYDSFSKDGMSIEAVFDIDPMKHREGAIPIYPIEKLEEFIRNNKVTIGIIAVPHFAAQQVLDIMVSAGIKGVLNFASVSLRAPDDIFINDMHVGTELEIIGYFVKALQK
ncbi:MAG: redox-sensing transcriptional repressor Rex [Candidatus Omnitrophica bacterium]|nr:redox-sensing transcriptional repressor Rex [Candidatus Omnitrophota bacterium]